MRDKLGDGVARFMRMEQSQVDAKTFIGRINQIKSSPEKLRDEDRRLSDLIQENRHFIEDRLTPNSIAALLTLLGVKELSRVCKGVDYEISDFAGFARYLRGLAVKQRFVTWEPISSPDEEKLLKACDSIWKYLFYREMIVCVR